MDYRLPENRGAYFSALYKMNLEQGVHPGLVYLYMPELARRYGWTEDQKLWFAAINGMTQNPITSMIIMEQLPECPAPGADLTAFTSWFNESWENLQFDVDKRYQKKDTVAAIESYARLAVEAGGQVPLLTGDYASLWRSLGRVTSFGRLGTFSYLEYVYIMGHGADCDNLLFQDKSGSRSHRNGMFFLLGLDELVWDKRMPNGHTGDYGKGFKPLCEQITKASQVWLARFKQQHPELEYAGNFTFESQCCAFKNGFFSRRYPGVYADLGWERIQWADEHGLERHTQIFKDIRAERLPDWLRIETETNPVSKAQRASMFAETGVPHRAEHFLLDTAKL